MQLTLTIIGKSSGSEKILQINKFDRGKTLLEVLLNHNLPIAYSCKGEMICKKCIVNGDKLSCQYNVEEYINTFGNEVSVDYL